MNSIPPMNIISLAPIAIAVKASPNPNTANSAPKMRSRDNVQYR